MLTSLPFRIAALLSAFLIFLVQPMLAKQILPWFGGAPGVWTASLLFFQFALTLGYVYAHLIGRLGIRWQVRIHVTLLIAAVWTLPLVVAPAWKPVEAAAPASRVLGALMATAGLPFVLLSASAPLLQSWWPRVSGTEPYRLYSLSNVGSLAALAAFPFVIEPALAIPAQAIVWSTLYVLCVGVLAWAAWTMRGTGRPPTAAARSSQPYAIWILLSACGSALLSATTNQLCQDVAVVPLLWVLPLAVYLLTFIVAFGGSYPRRAVRVLVVFGGCVSLAAAVFAGAVPMLVQIAALLILLGAACMACHGELYATRPARNELTAFYVAVGAGGALGGAFVALAAPRLFTSFVELPLLVLFAFMTTLLSPSRISARLPRSILPFLWIAPAICVVSVLRLPLSHATASRLVDARRDFFGVLRVEDHDSGTSHPWRALYHGRVLHGLQARWPGAARLLTSYYGEGSGVGLAFNQHEARRSGRALRVGVIGLGAGTIAGWGHRGDDFTFFELDPMVETLARRYFTFLSDSPASTRVVIGDARLTLERELTTAEGRHYDLLVVDAFSGDAVPVHLLTQECLDLYLRALAPGGVLAFHVSNRHLDLRLPLRGLAERAGLGAVERVVDVSADAISTPFVVNSSWVLASRDGGFLSRTLSNGATRLGDDPKVIWTDQFSSLISLLR